MKSENESAAENTDFYIFLSVFQDIPNWRKIKNQQKRLNEFGPQRVYNLD